jgi:Ran-interacting Mog1 protein
MAVFTTRELYGGAITAQLPEDYIDASDLRQVPDHQEVFLSPKTLTSVIFEINQYVKTTNDANAVHFHFNDVIPNEDRLAGDLAAPTQVEMTNPSVKDFLAYFIQGTIVSPEADKKAPSTLPIDWQQNPETKDVLTKAYQLVVRMAKYETDLCIRINVPLKEMLAQEDASKEEDYVKGMTEKIVATFDVKDFGLFGAE